MRTLAMLTAATTMFLGLNASPAHADHGRYARLVDGWYHRYLGRHVDPAGLRDHVRALRCGTPPCVVEAAILSSPEYYHRNGCTPEGFVVGLYRDVRGTTPCPHELRLWTRRVIVHGRNATAQRFLCDERVAVPVVTRPMPVVPSYRVPVVRPVPVYPTGGLSINVRVGR